MHELEQELLLVAPDIEPDMYYPAPEDPEYENFLKEIFISGSE